MNRIRTWIRHFRRDERGFVSPFLIVVVPSLILIVGIVVDGSGKIQAHDAAQNVATSASRAAANALATQAITNGGLQIDESKAAQVAMDYIYAAGMTGTASVNGDTITVHVETNYATKFVSIIGIDSLPASADATAQLLTE